MAHLINLVAAFMLPLNSGLGLLSVAYVSSSMPI